MRSGVLRLAVPAILLAGQVCAAECNLTREATFQHQEIGPVGIYRDATTKAVVFASQMHVNTDGAPDSYHPDDIGITHICNGVSVGADCIWKSKCLPDFNKAKAEGFAGPTKICFFAMATDRQGRPIIQGPNDPKPGYFVSTTAFQQPGVDGKTPQAQIDSNTIPFIVIPSSWQRASEPGVKLGDFAVVVRRSTGAISPAIVGDLGPKKKLGEGSVALHQALGNDPFVDRSGKRRALAGIPPRDVLYIVFPGSQAAGEVITPDVVEQEVDKLLSSSGGKERVLACAQNVSIR